MEHNHLNKLSITFQQQDQCEIWWKLAKWFLKNHDFIHVNSTVAGKYNKYKQDDGHLRFPIRTIFGQMSIYLPSRAQEILKPESVQPMMMTSSMSPIPKKKNMYILPVTKTNDNWQSYNSF